MYHKIRHIISGERKVGFGATIQAVASYLARSQTANPMDREHQHFKTEETKRLIVYIEDHNLWVDRLFAQFIAS